MSLSTRLVSYLLYASGIAERIMQARKKAKNGSITILAYHRIGSAREDGEALDDKIISASNAGFDWQMDYLQKNFEICALEDLYSRCQQGKAIPPNAAAVTFDDGYRDNFDQAFPILFRRQIPAVIYLVTSMIGTVKRLWWDEVSFLTHQAQVKTITDPRFGKLSFDSPRSRLRSREKLRQVFKSIPNEQREQALETLRRQLMPQDSLNLTYRAFLDWSEVRTMQQNGISFGAHSHTHPILSHVSEEQAAREISESKRILESKTGRPARLFAYPNGRSNDFNRQTQDLLRQNGFETAVTLIHGINPITNVSPDWLALRRLFIGSDDRAVFVSKVSGALEKIASPASLLKSPR